jgi:hypothetical protein
MSRENLQIVEKILNNLKIALKMKSDKELANHLKLSTAAISAWRARNSFDFLLILTKCSDISIDYLITGEGPIYLNERNDKYSYVEVSAGNLVSEKRVEYNKDDKGENRKIIELEAQVSILRDIIIEKDKKG